MAGTLEHPARPAPPLRWPTGGRTQDIRRTAPAARLSPAACRRVAPPPQRARSARACLPRRPCAKSAPAQHRQRPAAPSAPRVRHPRIPAPGTWPQRRARSGDAPRPCASSSKTDADHQRRHAAVTGGQARCPRARRRPPRLRAIYSTSPTHWRPACSSSSALGRRRPAP
eukprot:scaffold26996_cov60-Phaeocystis_antarctica.AAC.2